MSKKRLHLTKSEMEIMELLWKENHEMTGAEIIECSADKSWKPNSIHILLRSMLEKKVIKIVGFALNTKKYARTFTYNISPMEYAAIQVKTTPYYEPAAIPRLFKYLLADITEPAILHDLEILLRRRKQQLAERNLRK